MSNPRNAGNEDSNYKKHGYSERSLEMLESEEGQLNAVFACYGSAAQHGQLFEESLAKLVALLNECLETDNPAAGLEKKTIGQLLWLFKTKFVQEVDDWVPEFLDEAKERRNFLIHEYFLTRSDEMGVEGGRLAMLRELAGIEAHLRHGAALVNGLRVAIEEAKRGVPEENSEGKTIFSINLRIKGNSDAD